MSIENKIRLNASNNDDLKIFSFLCQDAIISKEEIFYDKTENFFVATLTRYCWEQQKLNDKNVQDNSIRFHNLNQANWFDVFSELGAEMHQQ